MLQTLKRNSKKKIILNAKFKQFIKHQLWVYIIVFTSIGLCAWISNRWIEGLMFCVAHTAIRNAFDKQFHFNKTAYCLILTLTIVWFAIPITLPVSASLLSSIPVAFIICLIGFIAQDRVDLQKQIKSLDEYTTELVKSISHKDVYAMNEEELYQHCRNCGLDEEECKLAYFFIIERLHGKELYKALPYSEATIKRKRLKILSKIQKDVTVIKTN